MRRSHAAVALGSLVSERDWQRQVCELAELYGYRWVHFRPARTAHGWRTPVSGPLGAGWPDLILARAATPERPGRLIFAELKAEGARLSPPQRAVHDELRATERAEVYTWQPSDLDRVAELLR